MLVLTVEVDYPAQGQTYSVRVSTLVEEASDDEDSEDTTDGTSEEAS